MLMSDWSSDVCSSDLNVDAADLKDKIAKVGDRLAALMITYPSTHGVFETAVTEICGLVHDAGGQVYLDGANMNAMVGLAQPGRSEEHTSELQSLMRISYAVCCLNKTRKQILKKVTQTTKM